MHRKSSIGFLLGVLCLCGLYCASDRLFYNRETTEKEMVPAREASGGREEPLDLYYLKESEGLVYVYERDGKTLYERTSISLDVLPDTLREEIRQGKGVQGLEELFGFLENYSS